MRNIVILLLLSSCAFDQDLEYRVDPDLKSYVDRFYTEAVNRGYKIKHENLLVKFEAMEHRIDGVTKIMGDQRIVYINNDNTDPKQLTAIVAHELGHALLGRDHCKNKASIMYKEPANADIDNPEVWNELFE